MNGSEGVIAPRGWLPTLVVLLLGASSLSCDDFWQQRAGCEQAVLAFCEMTEHCERAHEV